ncbi:MAG: archaeal proteasome endopeptidase complex subunit alpha [Candidatus Thorarchaeota archaeon]|nr:MAG: archaeal proteasome endopeptidase complex subunit alpha [Candidatus Thorarchaeota archaeon]
MFPSQSMGYDRAITVFSPEGRLYQVEYATEAVRHGPLAVGVKAVDGVVLAGEKRSPHTLVDLDTLRKILLVDDHIGTAIAGLHADARKLIDEARLRAQINRLSYDEPISIQSLVVNICDIKQAYTQAGGYRPFGVSLLVGGIDHDGPQLFTTDPSGSFWGWKATAIGKESDVVRDFFKENYSDKMDIEAAMKFAMEGLLRNGDDSEEDLKEKAKSIEIGRIDTTDKTFKILTQEEVEAILATK